MRNRRILLLTLCVGSLLAMAVPLAAADLGSVPRYHVIDVTFAGSSQTPRDTPARDVELTVVFRHESGETVRVPGFWDGDGRGAVRGNAFKVRFCPTKTGVWTIAEAASNDKELQGQRVDDTLKCVPSQHAGFWIPDGRWYRRSDGSHPLVVGNTHYTFISRRNADGPVKTDPAADIRANAEYYQKLRFSLLPCRYPDPSVKPFFDDQGRQTDDGRFSRRPNPQWFRERVDPVVREGFACDLVCDLILCGPDTVESRSTLQEDPTPWLRYIAARYGSFPNVWICLCNEWNIKRPSYTAKQIRAAGKAMKSLLAYPTPLSIHGNSGDWDADLNGDWHDHVILQDKIKRLDRAADVARKNFRLGGRKPVVNDENAYQGRGDGFTRDDTIEGCLGTFLGGGYPTTGEKPAGKHGQYFWGGFDPHTHTASEPLGMLRDYVDRSVELARLQPVPLKGTPFDKLDSTCRLLAAEGVEYVLGSRRAAKDVIVALPPGQWRVTQLDLIGKTTTQVSSRAAGEFTFTLPQSRATVTHFRKASD